MAIEVERLIGAGRDKHTEARKTHRNGYQERPFDTRIGTLTLDVPKIRQKSDFPSVLEKRQFPANQRAEESDTPPRRVFSTHVGKSQSYFTTSWDLKSACYPCHYI